MLTNRQKLDLISLLVEEKCFEFKINGRTQKFLNLLYKISHPHKKCQHKDWEKQAEALYKDFKSKNIL